MPTTIDRPTDSSEVIRAAIGMLMARARNLPKHSRDNVLDLIGALPTIQTEEEFDEIVSTMIEILANEPIVFRRISDGKPLPEPLQKWADFTGGRIRDCRKAAGLTQVRLAEMAEIPQGHLSRLENGEHAPNRFTVAKIAKALNVPIGAIGDRPAADDQDAGGSPGVAMM